MYGYRYVLIFFFTCFVLSKTMDNHIFFEPKNLMAIKCNGDNFGHTYYATFKNESIDQDTYTIAACYNTTKPEPISVSLTFFDIHGKEDDSVLLDASYYNLLKTCYEEQKALQEARHRKK